MEPYGIWLVLMRRNPNEARGNTAATTDTLKGSWQSSTVGFIVARCVTLGRAVERHDLFSNVSSERTQRHLPNEWPGVNDESECCSAHPSDQPGLASATLN